MGKFRWILVLVVGMLSLLAGSVCAAGGVLPGTGSDTDPYLIEDFDDFEEFCSDSAYWDDYIRLDCDLDLSSETYTYAPIAGEEMDTDIYNFEGVDFTGSFDGNNHVISNLRIVGASYCGLFGSIETDFEVKNLGLENVTVNCTGHSVGALAGWSSGTVTNCFATGEVRGDKYVGGLLGHVHNNDYYNLTYFTISDCYSECSVYGTEFVGGLIGRSQYSFLEECYATGDISATSHVGGLAGMYYSGSITECYSTCDVQAFGGDDIGNLVGLHNCAVIQDCYATGDVCGTGTNVGGLVGESYFGDIFQSYSIGDVEGEDFVGGLVGRNSGGEIEECYTVSSVHGNEDVGGFAGSNHNNIRNCYALGPVDGFIHVGGFVGSNNDNSYVINCYSAGHVNCSSPSAGGFCGWNTGDIIACFWDKLTSGMTSSYGGTGQYTQYMKEKDIYIYAGWDLTNVWKMLSGHYPLLKWQQLPKANIVDAYASSNGYYLYFECPSENPIYSYQLMSTTNLKSTTMTAVSGYTVTTYDDTVTYRVVAPTTDDKRFYKIMVTW